MKVFGIVGWKNSGKTTLVEKLVGEISRRGYSVSTNMPIMPLTWTVPAKTVTATGSRVRVKCC